MCKVNNVAKILETILSLTTHVPDPRSLRTMGDTVIYSTVTDFARLRGKSTLSPSPTASQ
jgi:hypothetical protein